MTLLTTEIHQSPIGNVIVFAADQRITRGNDKSNPKPKIFQIASRRAGIGYFGLAEVNGSSGCYPMSDWLRDFFYQISELDSLALIAEKLANELKKSVPDEVRKTEPSGFHLSGFTQDGETEFWLARNFEDDGRLSGGQYFVREDYRARDQPHLLNGETAFYRSGDVRAHVAAWGKIDESLGTLLGTPSFRKMQTVEDYVNWVKFKMEVIAQFYEQFCNDSIIGTPVDCFAII